MIGLLRRKISLNKTSTFSKETNGPIYLKIANVNVLFVLSRLKISTQHKCELINSTGVGQGAIRVAPCKNVPSACTEFQREPEAAESLADATTLNFTPSNGSDDILNEVCEEAGYESEESDEEAW